MNVLGVPIYWEKEEALLQPLFFIDFFFFFWLCFDTHLLQLRFSLQHVGLEIGIFCTILIYSPNIFQAYTLLLALRYLS